MRGFTVWFTGLPGSGKTTLANALAEALREKGLAPVILDGDEVRTWLTRDLGFSKEDRRENVLRVARVARLIVDSGGVAIVSLVSPYESHRHEAINIIGEKETMLVYLYGRVSENLWEGTEYEIPALVPTQGQKPTEGMDTRQYSAKKSVGLILRRLEYRKLIASRHSDAPSLFLGRWSPFHDGHKALVEKVLNEGKSVIIAIRDTAPSKSDPYTLFERVQMIHDKLRTWGTKVRTVSIPDFSEICIGRTAGYGIRQIHLDEETESISGTKIREEAR